LLIGDGVVPSNEGRGYVLRRLIRRAVRHAWSLGSSELVTPALAATTIEAMAEAYPDLTEKQDFILDMVSREEARFRRTLESGHGLLEAELADLDSGAILSGATAFKLHDTYGFPVELTEEIAAERGVELDRTEFETMMDQQRARARSAWKGGDLSESADLYRAILDAIGPSVFLGYDEDAATGRVLSMLREGETVERAEEGQDVEVFLDRTPFYAESGGQLGDVGEIVTPTGRVRVGDTQFGIAGLHGHRGTVVSGHLQTGQDATATIDGDRRERIRKSHTGTHLLHWGLRDVLGSHVQQAGSLVDAGRLRFDFSHYAAVEPDELAGIEATVNHRVVENAAVTTAEMAKADAEAMGALAFFGDKYGDRVRVVRAGDYSTEFCGGTHVPSTGQVGPLIVLGESSIGSNMRRVEALTGTAAYDHITTIRRRLEAASDVLRSQPDAVVDAARALIDKLRAQEEQLAAFGDQGRAQQAAGLLGLAEDRGPYQLIVSGVGDMSPGDLRSLAMQVRDRVSSGIVVLGSAREGKGSLLAIVTKDLVARGVAAGELLAPAAAVLGGGGSRDPELSQAGGPHGDRLDDALEVARDSARTALGSL
jgi:alanyl-tRNA synthetase